MNKGLVTASALLVAMVSGCTAGTDKSGGELQPTLLVLASVDGTSISSPAVTEFVKLVDELSEGSVQVEVSPEWHSRGEQLVLEDVAAGQAALGWSGTRALDLVGVDAFRPLHAPFLISSYAAQRAVVGDDVARDMLSALDGSELTGLALLADELRFPAGAEGPLVDPKDFEDLDFGTAPSNAQAAGVAALGARPKGVYPPHTDGLGGLETMWWTYIHNNQQRVAPFVTANAVLWPRTTVIVGNPDILAGLSEQDRNAVTEAAEQARSWSINHADDGVADEMVAACRAGARIAIASAHQLVTLRQTAAQAYADLRAHPEQATLLDRIERLVAGVPNTEPLEVPQGCAYRPGDAQDLAVPVLPPALDGPGSPGALPIGTYRYTLTEDEIRKGADVDAATATANAGVWTWKLGDGRWSYVLKLDAQEMPEGYAGATCEGYYDVRGNQVEFTTMTVYASGDCASATWKATWRETGDGLAMDVTTDGPELDFLFGAKPWERIG
jgi:TRAP-type C4-dicarboxylate transport system substrate-binding protein